MIILLLNRWRWGGGSARAADLIQDEVNMKDERRGLAKLAAGGSRLR
jgi:hypothetical protein